MVSLKSLGDIMKKQINLLRKRLKKNHKRKLKRLKKTKEADEIVVATTKTQENKLLLEYLKKIKVNFFCGSE